ncbi:MAG: ketoacyl-ACP synthase III [Nitrospirae bacterium]|nr:ketoacyl-ACP synthase III [Nitrospirota bacterium]
MNVGIKISSMGLYVPPEIETAGQLGPLIGRSAEWIISRTGVETRHVSREPVEVMAAKAAREAIGAGPPPDLILNASTTPRQFIPDTSVFIQNELGLKGVTCYSVHATCLSFLAALQTAAGAVSSGMAKRVLIVSAEVATRSRNFSRPESAALFGDGAAAAIIEPTPEGQKSGLLSWRMKTWPEGAHLTEVRGGGLRRHPLDPATTDEDNLFQMDGPGVYRLARKHMQGLLDEVFGEACVTREDLALIVPHQASGPALDSAAKYGAEKSKVARIIGEYGNCVAASIPMALAISEKQGKVDRGDLVLLVGTGAGLSIGAAVLRW